MRRMLAASFRKDTCSLPPKDTCGRCGKIGSLQRSREPQPRERRSFTIAAVCGEGPAIFVVCQRSGLVQYHGSGTMVDPWEALND
jgi:hypothetical protein